MRDVDVHVKHAYNYVTNFGTVTYIGVVFPMPAFINIMITVMIIIIIIIQIIRLSCKRIYLTVALRRCRSLRATQGMQPQGTGLP